MRHIVLCLSISMNELTTVSTALEREMRHIAQCDLISTNELTTLFSTLERELWHIVLCVSISTNQLMKRSSTFEREMKTHYSMCVHFYEWAYEALIVIGERNETHCSMCVYLYEWAYVHFLCHWREKWDTFFYVCLYLRMSLRQFPQHLRREMRHIVLRGSFLAEWAYDPFLSIGEGMVHIVLFVSISTNKLTIISSALEREMGQIVLCVYYFYEWDYKTFHSNGEKMRTHCSMWFNFYKWAYDTFLTLEREMRTHCSMFVYFYALSLTTRFLSIGREKWDTLIYV